jgi:hypothetical protein
VTKGSGYGIPENALEVPDIADIRSGIRPEENAQSLSKVAAPKQRLPDFP